VHIKIERPGVRVDGINFTGAGGSLSAGKDGKHHEQETVCQSHCAVDDIWTWDGLQLPGIRIWLVLLGSYDWSSGRHERDARAHIEFNAIDSRP